MHRYQLFHSFLPGAALLVAGLGLPVAAAVPHKQPLGRYAPLWTDSPFTVKPVKEVDDTPQPSVLDDYTLAGVAQIKGGWFVVLMNKKKRGERVRLKPNETNTQGFKVVNVQQGKGYKETKVEIMAGGRKSWVGYDEKFLVLKNPPIAKKKPVPTKKPGVRPVAPRPTQPGARPPRIRRVPTPPAKPGSRTHR